MSADSHDGSAPKTALGPLLQAVKLPKTEGGRLARDQASGSGRAQPSAPRPSPEARARELEARKRVAALVSGGLHFKLKREADHVQATRGTAPAKLCARLASKIYAPELTFDVRTLAGADMRDSLAGYLRLVHRRGVRQLLITLDDGTASAQDREQRLQDVIVALTQGAAAPLVRAFSTAHENLGGIHGLAVLLI
jgi:DNA-nicking Smr family endonuclease